jgi:hypothetical protein
MASIFGRDLFTNYYCNQQTSLKRGDEMKLIFCYPNETARPELLCEQHAGDLTNWYQHHELSSAAAETVGNCQKCEGGK